MGLLLLAEVALQGRDLTLRGLPCPATSLRISLWPVSPSRTRVCEDLRRARSSSSSLRNAAISCCIVSGAVAPASEMGTGAAAALTVACECGWTAPEY